MSVPSFHYIQTQMANFHEMMMSDKKEAIVWSRRSVDRACAVMNAIRESHVFTSRTCPCCSDNRVLPQPLYPVPKGVSCSHAHLC